MSKAVHLLLAALVLFSPALAEEGAAAREKLIRSLVAGDDALGSITLGELVQATTGKKVLPLDSENDPVAQRILAALKNALATTLEQANAAKSEARRSARINEASKFFEDRLREVLNATPGFSCDHPKTRDGKVQRSGYPDLRLVHQASGRVVYLDPKVYAEDSTDSSFRTFYYEPGEGTGKILEDAHHLILGIAHDGKTGAWTYTAWKIVDVATLPLQLKTEFNASNRELYRSEAVRAEGK